MMIMEQSFQSMESPLIEVEDDLVEATMELFDAYGISLWCLVTDEDTGTPGGAMITSTIGFAGDNIRGALVLSTTIDVVRQWQMQFGSTEESAEAASDTIGEFSNMLLGR